MEPNFTPKPNTPPEEPVEQSVDQPAEQSVVQPTDQTFDQSVEQSTEPASDQPVEQPVETPSPIEATEPELTAQVDDLMATSAAATTEAEAPLAPEVVEPTVSTPEIALAAEVPALPAPEVAASDAFAPAEPLPAESEAFSAPLPVEPAATDPEVVPVAAVAPPTDPVAASAMPTKQRSWLKPAVLVLAVVVGLAAISAAVYAEVIVPNRPDYVLMKALENSVQQSQVSYKGSVDLDSNGTATKLTISGAQDNTKQASDLNLTASMSGLTLPVEARLVDKNVYVKVGDLTPVVSLLGAFGDPSTTKVMTAVSQQLSNKWVSIDSTLLKQAGLSCFTDNKFALTQADVKLLEDQYEANTFATIQSTSNDIVNGQKVVKYQLSIDDDKAVKYGSSLNSLSVNKTLQGCNKNVKSSTTANSLRDHKQRPLTVWVIKGSKQIVQIASESTAQDASKGVKGSGKLTFSYGSVSISAPSDSVPLLEVVANLKKSLGIPSTSTTDNGFDLSKLLGSGVSANLSNNLNR